MKTTLHFLAIAVILAIAGCHDTFPPTDPKNPNDSATLTIDVTRWCLESISGPDSANIPSIDPALGIYIEFSKSGQVKTFGGCNNFNGTYQISNGSAIHIGDLAGTKIHCPETISIETLYTGLLKNALAYTIVGTHLTIICSGGNSDGAQRTLRFVSCRPNDPPPPPVPTGLAGRRWCLQQIQNTYSGNSRVSVNQWVGIHVQFDLSGALSGYTDSSRFTGTYTVDGNKLTIANLAVEPITPNAVALSESQSLQGYRIGSRFLTALRAAVAYRIDSVNQMLQIYPAFGDPSTNYNKWDTLILTDCTPSRVDTVQPGERIFTSMGRLVKVAGELLSYRIGAITDNRCPSGTQCVQAGEARVPIYLMLGVVPKSVTLKTTGESQTADSVAYPNMPGNPNYLLLLTAVDPYPQPGVTVNPEDYAVGLTVIKR